MPVALSSAEARDHPSPLAGSGSVAATTSVGMVISVLTFSRFTEEMLQGKAPFFAFGWLLLLGNWLFFAAEWL